MDLHDVARRAEDALLQQGEHPFTLFIGLPDRPRPVKHGLLSLPHTPKERTRTLFELGMHVGEKYRARPVRWVTLVTEVWFSETEVGNPVQFSPSSDPNRREALLVIQARVLPTNTEHTVWLKEIVRDGQKHIAELRSIPRFATTDGPVEIVTELLLAFLMGVAVRSPNRAEFQHLLAQYRTQFQRMKELVRGVPTR